MMMPHLGEILFRSDSADVERVTAHGTWNEMLLYPYGRREKVNCQIHFFKTYILVTVYSL